MNATATKNQTVEAISEMLSAWNKIERHARELWPRASKEELFSICSAAMCHALGLDLAPRAKPPLPLTDEECEVIWDRHAAQQI